MIEDMHAGLAERYGNPRALGGEPPKSVLYRPPLVLGGRATGVDLAAERRPRACVQRVPTSGCSTTLAGSVSVALENARLVHETRQRNAELALINSVQAAIAGELDPQAIYDLVGDRLRRSSTPRS